MEANEFAAKVFLYVQNRSIIIELTTVVRGRENCDKFSFGIELIAIFHNLMRTANQVYFMLLTERIHNCFIKLVAYTSIIVSPARLIPHSTYSLSSLTRGIFVSRV